jgi:hypothetical protein
LKIKVERSGGIAGIVRSTELDSKELPSSLVSKLKKIIQDSESSSIPLKVTPRGAADHYTYKISVRDGSNIQVIECNQFNLQDDFKSLISYFEKHSKRD